MSRSLGRGNHDLLQIFPTVLQGWGRGKEKAKASSAAVIYKCSFLSGLHNELGNYQGQLTHITSLLTKSQEPHWQLKKRHFGDHFGNVRKLELAQAQNPGLPRSKTQDKIQAIEGAMTWIERPVICRGTAFPKSLLRDLIFPYRDPAQEECRWPPWISLKVLAKSN